MFSPGNNNTTSNTFSPVSGNGNVFSNALDLNNTKIQGSVGDSFFVVFELIFKRVFGLVFLAEVEFLVVFQI